MLSNEWIVKEFYPIDYLPKGVRLTAYGGESSDLPAEFLQNYLDKVAAGTLKVATPKVYNFTQDDVRQAHDDMENNRAVGKLVVRIG
jgi:NADPH:quinone reductase-like Zn-dependent oxidoreductase